MKKFTLSLTLILGFCALAKSQNDSPKVADIDTTNLLHSVDRIQQNFDRRQSQSGWYSFGQDYGTFNGLTYSNFVNFVFPDSCHIVYPENGLGRVNTHVFGSMFDPKDFVFGSNSFSRWTDYSYDSLAWFQSYIRQVDSLDNVILTAASGKVTVVDFSTLNNAVFSIDTFNLTEGVEWDAETDNFTTASSLANAIASIQVSGSPLFTTNVNGNEIEIISNILGFDGNSISLNSSDIANLSLSNSTLLGGNETIQTVEIVDTLFIQHFTGADAALGITTLNFVSDPTASFFAGLPNINNYQPSTLFNTGAFKTDTILLTAEMRDSITPQFSFLSTGYTLAVNKDVAGSNNIIENVIASSFIFKPMKKYNINDTLISLRNDVLVANKHNMLGISYVAQTGQTHRIVSNEAINNLFSTNSSLRYGQVGIGGWRSYAPFLGGFSRMFYHVSTENLSATTLNANGYGLGDAYPNPTDNTEAFTIPFSLGASDIVTFTVTDITGKVVNRISNNYSSGENFVTIETTGLTTGVYFYTMTTGAFSGVGKVIVR